MRRWRQKEEKEGANEKANERQKKTKKKPVFKLVEVKYA